MFKIKLFSNSCFEDYDKDKGKYKDKVLLSITEY